ncbi:PREDICTED: WRKY transcription factor 44-like [Populus euphratica]|uniref:WRKY transcription factor 44-like n=1 Tax=Populus euphratica TaxID=75702 RepID=A0AAJ6X3L5_POPEU|nr:PREDICTED: WRKY transcription factor 44-like [Populus euphratica]XP_011004129.1 PREDICTED: WRKY transcription factor 44-like [Populus euphratica]XP_011004130.1 PREDICTED: WRKY transcription factor 44-like [Populus euphratica]XP_011004131.1 PREDICTED: WRKY transcription factor 44-like [Populus euphratica]
MEIKESERVVIAKPVASRPSYSNFTSFSELLAGAINTTPSNVCSGTAVAAIRPKTVRFRPVVNRAPGALVSSQAELSGTAVSNSFNKVSGTDSKATIIYKPQAKLVSKATVSLLANMGNFNPNSQQMLQPVETRPPLSKQDKHNFSSQLTSNLHQNIPSHAEADHATEPLRLTSLNQEEDPKTLSNASNGDRPSYDGYNWRKYGQKQVKGSEYPRSYYKCTYPNCPVKKKVERSFDGQIAEIVYKGEHNHSKPQPPKRNSSVTQGLSDGNASDRNSTPLWSNQLNERNEGSEGREENQNEIGLPVHSIYQGKAPPSYDPAGTGTINAGTGTPDNSGGVSGECDGGSKGLEGATDEPKSKRRKTEIQSTEGGMSGEGVQEPRVVVQSSTDSEILGDGFRWRKYGQKIVKGNPYPRSYYRCTSIKCNVRKHVERVSDDPRAFITTYEGKHNHEMPLKITNLAAFEPDSQAPTTRDKQ